MNTLDLVIIFGYLIGITVFGIYFAGRRKTTENYFVGDTERFKEQRRDA